MYKKLILNFILPLAIFSLTMQAVFAEGVKMLNTLQSAEEMGAALFAQPIATPKPKKRMRSISFGSKKTNKVVESIITREEIKSSTPQTLGLPIKFAVNSTQILAESLPFIEEIGKMLTLPQYANERVMIEGHTDASGSFDKNLILSYRRASAIKKFLISNYQFSPNRLEINGRGEKEPLSNTDPNAAVNGRVQLYKVN